MRETIKNFGGGWSGDKLEALRDYLISYMLVLKKQPFKLAYIDAFAGAGVREVQEGQSEDNDWFDEESVIADQQYRHGSPLIALSIDPPFDKYIFIEQDENSLAELRNQVEKFDGSVGKSVEFCKNDANEKLLELAGKNWKKHGRRGVVFLDPFALQVRWDTIEAIGRTQAIDMWLLFPAMAVNRMLPKNGIVPDSWAERLNQLFGDDSWRDVFYSNEGPGLFGDEFVSKTPKIFETLSFYITSRLKSVFAGTPESPMILRNKSGAPLFLLCFASGNPKGAATAVRIAQHIINEKNNG